MKRDTNGKYPFVWVNGKCYASYGDRLLEFDPWTESGILRWVFPADERALGSAEINGEITAITGDADWLYVALKNRAGNTYILKVLPKEDGTVVHTWAYLGANDCNAMIVAGPGVVHADNPCLVFGYGAGVSHFILPRAGLRPEDDSNYRYSLTEGLLYGPWVDANAKTYDKLLNAGRLVTENTSAGKPVELSYEVDSGSTTSIVTATAAGISTGRVTTEVLFSQIRYLVEMSTPDNAVSPRGIGVVLNVTPKPPRKRIWSLDIVLSDDAQIDGGGIGRASAADLERFLYDATGRLVTLYDRTSRTFSAHILDVQGVGIRAAAEGDEQLITLTLAEVTETTTGADSLIWNQDAYTSGKTWG